MKFRTVLKISYISLFASQIGLLPVRNRTKFSYIEKIYSTVESPVLCCCFSGVFAVCL